MYQTSNRIFLSKSRSSSAKNNYNNIIETKQKNIEKIDVHLKDKTYYFLNSYLDF